MSYTDEERAANDRRVANDVAKHGCHVISVFDPKEKLPTFSYSIGIQDSAGAPDALVIGLGPKLGHSISIITASACGTGRCSSGACSTTASSRASPS